MKLTLGFSSCPNDTFMFDALVNQKVDTEGLDFEVFTHDIENLNKELSLLSSNINVDFVDTTKIIGAT